MENVYGNNAFYWWMGVVEDRNDPLYLGRCKVRIVGHHISDTGELPTSDLPWAFPMQPITSAAMSGVGQTPIGAVEGTWVIGFFRDGDDCQEPVMMGTMGGIPGKTYQERLNNITGRGFQDPNKKYPLTELLDEPDTNRLARNHSIDKTIVQTKKINRTKGVSIAFGEESGPYRKGDSGDSWDQPDSPYSARYPYNHVTQSESGHVIEIDDTTNAERLHIYHRTGTFVEIDAAGSMVTRVIGNNYHITDCNGFISIKGKANITVDGSCNILVKNNCNIEVGGDLKTHVHGDYELNVAGKIDIAAGKEFTTYTDEDMSIQAKKGISAKSNTTIDIESKTVANIKAGTMLQMGGAIKTSISSLITEFGIVKMNAMSIVTVPPPLVTRATVRDLTPTKSASPSEEQVDPAELNIKSSSSTFPKLYLDGITLEDAEVIEENKKIIALELAADPPVAPNTPSVEKSVPTVPSKLDISKLKGHIPDAVLAQLPEVMAKFQINTALRLSHFLSQCSHETGDFTAVTENLNYPAEGRGGLLTIFSRYFPTLALAKEYERKPEKIANRAYGSRMGNGNEASGEGYKYRGRGYIQLTGKDNYTAFDRLIPENCISDPDIVATKYPLLSAAWYWNMGSLNQKSDKGESDAIVTEVTKKVNGGIIGLDDRINRFKKFYGILK